MANAKHLVVLPTLFIYAAQHIIMNAQLFTSINYLFLIERRFRALHVAYEKLQRKYVHFLRVKNPNVYKDYEFVMKLHKIFELFRELTDLIKLIEDIFGWFYASSITKNFTLTLFHMYFIFLTATDATVGKNRHWIAFGFAYELFGEFVKILVNIIAIHSIYAAVKIYK